MNVCVSAPEELKEKRSADDVASLMLRIFSDSK